MYSVQGTSHQLVDQAKSFSSQKELDNPETQKSLRARELRVAQLVHNGFISRDMQDRLKVSPEELAASSLSTARLLGGGGTIVVQREITLAPNQEFQTETDSNGRKVHVASELASVNVTVTYTPYGQPQNFKTQVLQSGPFRGTQNFASGRDLGHFQLTLKNTSEAAVKVYIHVENEGESSCALM